MIARMFLAGALLVGGAAPSLAATTAITNGRVVTLSAQGTLERGTVLVVDGRIASVGSNLRIPGGATIIDAAGGWITPGIFAPFSQIGLMEVANFVNTNDGAAKDAPFAAGFDVRYGLNGNVSPVDVARMAGVTRAAVFPSMGDRIFSGLGALVHLKNQIDILFSPRAFEAVELGEQGAQFAGGARGAAWVTLIEAFREAAEQPSQQIRGEPLLNRIDARALRAVLGGKTPLVVHVERAADILKVLSLTQSYPDLDLILLGASEGWMVAGAIAASGVPVILCPFNDLPTKFEMLGATRQNAARLNDAGVVVALSASRTPDAYETGLLTQGAGIAVANGMPWEAAFKAITLNPARIFGVAADLGSLQKGKRADIVIWESDPLELSSSATMVMIDGERQPLESRKTALRDRYIKLLNARQEGAQ